MKHPGNVSHFAAIRNRELYKAYRKAIANAHFINLKEVCRSVADTPCSRFWVSEERAFYVISEIYKGRYVLDGMNNLKREMYLEIFHRVDAMRQQSPEASLYDLVFDVVNSQAPKFYMTPESIVIIIWRIKNGHYKTT